MTTHSPHPHVRGERIARLRREHGLTQLDLAAATGLSISTVYRAEHGDSSIGPRTVARLASALDVQTAEIYDGDVVQLPPARPASSKPPETIAELQRQYSELLQRIESLQASIDRLFRTPTS